MLHVKRVAIPGPTSVAGRTLAQISDVHIGSRSPRLLKRIVERVNALKPDYVLITGDLIDFAGISRTELAPLGTFNAPAIFAIGNHERYVDLAAIDERMRALGVIVLRDEAVTHRTVSVHRHRRRRHRGAHSGAAGAHRRCRAITTACCCTTAPTDSTRPRRAAFR